MIQFLQNRVAVCLKMVCHFQRSGSHINYDDCVIKTITSNAKSREEQDDGKHSFVG